MSQLELITLECIKKQDVFRDKVKIVVDGETVPGGDIKIGKNDPPIEIDFKVELIGMIPITLIEVDKNGADEHLGTKIVDTAVLGEHTETFAESHFDYRLKYVVS